MKSKFRILFTSGLFCLGIRSFSQNQYVDLQPGVTNPASKPGWTLVFQDEFTGSKSTAWKNGFCWASGNSFPGSPYYFRNENYIQTANSLKLVAKEEDYTLPGTGILKHYTSAMLNSDPCGDSINPVPGRTFIYGYFETRCKNPKAQSMFLAFWLYGAGNANSPNNEIDAFEVGTGDGVIMTNHYEIVKPDGTIDHYAKGKYIYSVPGQTFGNTWVTYAVKWEPNKIVWYINNVPVRYETSLTSVIPNGPMRVKVQSAITRYSYDLNLLPSFPNEMEVDYVRVYQRTNHTLPDPVFRVNNLQSFVPSSPINIPFTSGLPIILNGSESYMPNHGYNLSIQRCDINGNVTGTLASRNLTTTEVSTIDKLNLTSFAQSGGLILSAGNYYRIVLGGSSPWTTSIQYIHLNSCTSNINFKINGQNNTYWPSAIAISNNYGKPKIIVDYSQTISCDDSYKIYLQECNASGVGTGTEIGKTMTATDKEHKSYFDIEMFAQQNNFALAPNKYYKVKIACGPGWTEFTQIIKINQCINNVSFKINNQSTAFPAPITIGNGQDIILDGTASGSPCNNEFYISVQECSSNGVGFGTEYGEVKQYASYNPASQEYFYSMGRFDIRDFSTNKGLNLNCGKYYLVKLAYTVPWASSVKVIYIAPCSTLNNSFLINGIDASTYNLTFGNTVNLYAPQSLSCNGSYYLSVQKRVNGNLTGPEIGGWLHRDYIYSLKETGTLNLKDFARDPNHDYLTGDGIELTNNSTYIVKFVPGANLCGPNTWYANYKIIYFGTGSGRENLSIENQQENFSDGMEVFPNPANDRFTVSLTGKEITSATLNLVNIQGKIIKSIQGNQGINIIDVNELPSGLYLLQAISGDNVFIKKIQITKD